MPDPTPEQLELLLELQATDSRVRRLQHQLDDLPEQQELDAAEARVASLTQEHDDLRLDLDRASAEQRQLERETEVLVQRRDAERVRLYDGSVAGQREFKAVEAEIETTSRRISEHEDQLLEVLERVEQLEARLSELDAAGQDGREQIVELAAARDEAAKGLLAQLAELGVERDRQATGLPDDLLARYESIAERSGGTGVGKLENQACTACRIELSRADVGELYAGPPLASCPQCRRLLVVPG